MKMKPENVTKIIFFAVLFLAFIGLTSAQPIINILNPKNNSTIHSEDTWLKVSTHEYAVCQYELGGGGWWRGGCNENGCGGDGGFGWGTKPKKMSQTGKLYHLQLIENLRDTINNETQGEWYDLAVTCEDDDGYAEKSVRFYVDIKGKILFLRN